MLAAMMRVASRLNSGAAAPEAAAAAANKEDDGPEEWTEREPGDADGHPHED